MSTDASATVSPRMRARAMVRTRFSEHPATYLAFARRKYPGPSPEVISSATQLVIDGYTRSATTYAVYALQLAQTRPVRLAHHLHAPAQLMQAGYRGVPVLALIREPAGAILSQLVREPWVDMRDAATAYARFYTSVMPFKDAFVIGEFDEVTHDFATVVRRINDRYGMSMVVPSMTAEFESRCLGLMKERPTLWPALLGFESGTVTLTELMAERQTRVEAEQIGDNDLWVPSAKRDADKAALLARWNGPQMRRLRERAESAYRHFIAS